MKTETVTLETHLAAQGLALFAHLYSKGYGFTSDCASQGYASFTVPLIYDLPAFRAEVESIAPGVTIYLDRSEECPAEHFPSAVSVALDKL